MMSRMIMAQPAHCWKSEALFSGCALALRFMMFGI